MKGYLFTQQRKDSYEEIPFQSNSFGLSNKLCLLYREKFSATPLESIYTTPCTHDLSGYQPQDLLLFNSDEILTFLWYSLTVITLFINLIPLGKSRSPMFDQKRKNLHYFSKAFFKELKLFSS